MQIIGYTDDGRMGTLDPGIESPGSQLITSLSYNQAAQLAAVNAGSSSLASYTYDGFGQRLLKTVSSTSGNIYQYGQNGTLLEEADQSGAAQADYIYLNGRPIATLDPSSGTLYYLHDDMLGTPQLASDGSQNAAWQATYGPFGQTSSVSGTITQNLRLPGQYFDVESGWNHNGFRNYIPDLGRYLEPDPLAMQGNARLYDPVTGHVVGPNLIYFGMDTYGYVNSNPVDLIDPFGLQPCNERKKNPFLCGSDAASRMSAAAALHHVPGLRSGLGGFIADAVGGNIFSGATDLIHSIATGASGGHSVFYNMGLSVVAGPTQGFGVFAKGTALGEAIEDSPWGADLIGAGLKAIPLVGEYASGIGELKAIYDGVTYVGAVGGCLAGIIQ